MNCFLTIIPQLEKFFLRKNIVAVLRLKTFSLKVKKLPILYFLKSFKCESLSLYSQNSSHNEFQLHIMF